MKRLLILSILIGCTSCLVRAQKTVSTLSPVARAYSDSLQLLKQRYADTTLTANPQAPQAPGGDVQSAKASPRGGLEGASLSSVEDFMLFSPFTYFHAPIHRLLTSSADTLSSPMSEDVARLLIGNYLQHPELVETDETKISRRQGIASAIDKPLAHEGNMVDKLPNDIVDPGAEPVELLIRKPNFWTFSGDYYLQFLQNYVSDNWYKGGESNYSALGSITMQANYNNKQKVKWDNKLEMKLGFIHVRSDSLHNMKTSDDLLRYTGKLGLQATKRWYYTFQALAYTQFYHGYKSNDPMVYSDFMAPFNLNLSLGMDYTVEWFAKRLKGTIHLAPIAYNFRYVRKTELSTRYGLKEGKHSLHDKGSQFTVDLEWKFSDMISWKTRLYGFTTYKKAELEWENTVAFKFNRYISSNLFLYPRFDDGVQRDGHHGYWQYKEFLSIGFAYSF